MLGHRRELGAVVALIDDLMGHDQVMFGIDGGLHVVTDDARAPAGGRHGAGVGIGQRDLLIRCLQPLGLKLSQALHLLLELGDLLLNAARSHG